MKKLVSFQHAGLLSLILFGVIGIFHLSVIIGIVFFDFVPVEYLWGGKMETSNQLLVFEIVSLAVVMVCFFVVLIRSERIRIPWLKGVAKIGTWVLFFLFVLNTIGNLLAESMFEKFFSIATAVLAVLCLRLALGK